VNQIRPWPLQQRSNGTTRPSALELEGAKEKTVRLMCLCLFFDDFLCLFLFVFFGNVMFFVYNFIFCLFCLP